MAFTSEWGDHVGANYPAGGEGLCRRAPGEYEALEKLANLPAFPEPRADGNYPPVEFARVSIARDIIKDRVRLGLTQAELARRAGIRVETLCRIETGKVTPTVGSIDKIDRALKAADARKARSRRKR